ncbi:hypothetical protein, partial [Sphaerochaeta sp. S2]|uniref:hypothetical protein n=1 Tax=Sphaerochaeta sp. S2 TaxID=2798868 RepID=UPI0018EA1AB7
STFDESFKQAVRSLKQSFISKKIEPIRETIQDKIEKHTNILQKDPHNFIKNLTSGKIVNSEFEAEEMKHFILFYSPTIIMINIRQKKVYYGVELENLAPEEKDEDFHLALFKFLSDPKRYKMIQMLSK